MSESPTVRTPPLPPNFDDYPPYLQDLAGMSPSSIGEDRKWARASLAPILNPLPRHRRGELWEAVQWIWRLKVAREDNRNDEYWNSLRFVRVWMVCSICHVFESSIPIDISVHVSRDLS